MRIILCIEKNDPKYNRSLMFLRDERVYYYNPVERLTQDFRSTSELSGKYYKPLKVLRVL